MAQTKRQKASAERSKKWRAENKDRPVPPSRTRKVLAEYNAKWYAENREKVLAYHVARRERLRTEVLAHYGDACTCCGERRPEFLTMDHINGDGAAHRREINSKGGVHFYHWIIKNDFPAFLQILCMNCNCAKEWYGRCPHEDE